jgi:tRNA (cmo5U34)-methyltransferase
MQKEHLLDSAGLTSESITNYINKNTQANEITCLTAKDDNSTPPILQENGFRYCGKRLVDGNVMIVYKWFRDLKEPYEDIGAFFDRRVQDYDLHMSDGNDSYESGFISLFKDLPDTNDRIRILDLGCGTGAELYYIFQKTPNANIVCVDIAEQMLRKLLELYPEHRKNLEIICSSYLELKLKDDYFDYVVACSTLHHLLPEGKLKLYRSISRWLKDKGSLLIQDYIADSPQTEDSLRKKYEVLVNNGTIDKNKMYHIDQPVTQEHEIELLKSAGLACSRVERMGESGILISAKRS